MSDLLFRGRGADVGGRAPAWLVRSAGAVLGLAIMQLAAVLGVWTAVGVSSFTARLVLMSAGALLATSSRGAWLWLISGLLSTALMLVSYTPLVAPLVVPFVRRDAVTPTSPPADAVVVLSGGVTSEGRVTGAALERLISGFQQARRLGIRVVALSVVGDDADPSVESSERDQRELAQLMAPDLELRFVKNVHSTRDEALAFAAMARTHGWRRVVVVTSPLHSRRACAAVEHAGLPVRCTPAASREYALSRLDRPENRRLAFADVVYESAATLLYALRGWTP
ncbi:YdcF family protein [Gemmatimonas groenlandica]|uniref:YdcF family protein n=1 Tax=Gemmatimonas groenlandica TaxID=2732249 RepID=A0A6M4IPI7_9BACT|nr:YdcF family protein [Gemmatimonas groenlandica]QJR34181.1 YdcF family protein [Gemmatimonas groenlandica]